MKISVITAFPELMRSYAASSVLGRAVSSGKLEVRIIDVRDFSHGAYRQIDDYCYGAGGMMLMAEPLAEALESASDGGKPYVVYPSPQGTHLHQELVEDLSRKEHLAIVCGHYEGIDERFTQKYVDAEISLGDFVLTGGEMPRSGRERFVGDGGFFLRRHARHAPLHAPRGVARRKSAEGPHRGRR